MIAVNADDLGRNQTASDRIVCCYRSGRITSTSAMVFMADSSRAAKLARAAGIDVGLHLNFSESLTGQSVPERVRLDHERVRRFLRTSKYALLIYNPLLRRTFRDLVRAQWEEFERLYGQRPFRVDGHQHLHLCSNVLIDCLI